MIARAVILAAAVLLLPLRCWACTNPDSIPAPAAFWGLTCETFVDNFASLADVDVNNTGSPTYTWFTNNAWPATTDPVWADAVPTPAGDFAISGGGLTITPTSDVYPVGNLSTCRYTSATPGYVGRTFTGAMYVDESVSWAGPGTGTNSWPDGWMAPTEWLAGGVGVTWDENDIFENQPGGGDRVTHEWNVTGGTVNRQNSGGAAVTLASPATYGTLIIPPALNGGTGLGQMYTNDAQQTAFNITFSAGAPATFNGSSGNVSCETGTCNPNGTFVPMSQQHFCLMLSAGPGGGATTFTKIQVWQAPVVGGRGGRASAAEVILAAAREAITDAALRPME